MIVPMNDVAALLATWLEPVGQALNPEASRRLLSLRADDRSQQRVEELADRNTEGLLTPEERTEYDNMVAAAALINVLQAQARAKLAETATSAA
jgi:hypothetical protein